MHSIYSTCNHDKTFIGNHECDSKRYLATAVSGVFSEKCDTTSGQRGTTGIPAGARPLTCHGAGPSADDEAAESPQCRPGASAGPAAALAPSPPPDTGPPADGRSQTKKSIGRQPPPALTLSRAGRRAVARHRTAIPHQKPTEASTPDK
ncbi:unnamed protein product, partial [Brenthis ino]